MRLLLIILLLLVGSASGGRLQFQGIMLRPAATPTPTPAGWTQRASDNFNAGTPGTDLTVSGNWTANQGVFQYSGIGAVVNFSSGVGNKYSYTGVSFLSNQYSQITLVFEDLASPNIGVFCRLQGTSGYALACDGTNLGLYRFDSGSFNSLVTAARTFAAGQRYRLEVVGAGSATRLTAYEDTGSGFVAVGTMTNIDPSTYYDNGAPGLYGFSGTTGFQADDWSGGDKT